MEEYLDLVDELDNVLGKMSRSKVYEEGLSNFRVINVFLRNSKGELWIPKRTATKRLFPLHLDVSAAGHVSAGESYQIAFVRELAEELNIDAEKVGYKEIAYFTPHENKVSAFMTVYEIHTDKDPDFNKDDFIEGHWMLPEKLIEILDGNVKAKGDLYKLIKLIYFV